MKPSFLLDACALIAYLTDEDGASIVAEFIARNADDGIILKMHGVNLLEVYYGFYRNAGKETADEMLTDVLNSGIHIVDRFAADETFFEAGRLKALYRISLADSILLAEAITGGSTIVTSDHHELDAVERAEKIRFKWIR